MTRLEQVQEILKKDKVSLTAIAAEFMKFETICFLEQLTKNNPDENITVEDLPEPHRSDVLNCYKKAKQQLEQKQ